jgi:phage-related protein
VIAPIAAIGAAVVGLGLLWKRFGGDIMRIVGNIADTVGRVFKGMGDVVSSVWDGVLGAVKGAINGVISVINGFIGAINSIQIHIPEVGVGPVHTPAFDWNGLNLGRIPFLAKGVRNFKGGYAWVGEAGPELAQFPAGTNVFSNRESRSMMGGSMTITHRIEDPSGVLAQMGATPGQLAQMVAESLNGEAFIRRLRHDSVRT